MHAASNGSLFFRLKLKMDATFATTVEECVGTLADYSVEDLKTHSQLELADLVLKKVEHPSESVDENVLWVLLLLLMPLGFFPTCHTLEE